MRGRTRSEEAEHGGRRQQIRTAPEHRRRPFPRQSRRLDVGTNEFEVLERFHEATKLLEDRRAMKVMFCPYGKG
jgi:hypothetical protein